MGTYRCRLEVRGWKLEVGLSNLQPPISNLYQGRKYMTTVQGVYITILGMAILFAALLILMLVAIGLERLFRPKQLSQETPAKGEKELVAAIAVAIALKLKAPSSKLQSFDYAQDRHSISNIQYPPSEGASSAWKLCGRQRQLMNSRRVKGRRG
jgi:Na+-transporting methylmalonyl-CoA/oxaloacetate decarboxylase gamma subunit